MDFSPQYIELFAQLFWMCIWYGIIFLSLRIVAFFFMPDLFVGKK